VSLKSFLTPAMLLTGVLLAIATLQQATGLFVQTFSSSGAVFIEGEATATPIAGVLTPIDSPSTQPVAAIATATATAESAGPTSTPSATATPAETATEVPEATATRSPESTATEMPHPAATATARATATPPPPTATPSATSTPDPTATAAPCPPEGLALAMEPADGLLRLDAKGEARVDLVNVGSAGLPAGSVLRLLGRDGVSPAAGVVVVSEDGVAAGDDASQGWPLPSIAAGGRLEVVLHAKLGPAVSSTEAVETEGRTADVALTVQRRSILLQVTYACGRQAVTLAEQKLVFQPAPLPEVTTPALVPVQTVETKQGVEVAKP
jgi:hypothetical protein